MKRVSMEPSERLASLQAEWDSQPAAEQGPCGEHIPGAQAAWGPPGPEV